MLSRPQLSIFKAWELFTSGRPDADERFLQTAEMTYDLDTKQISKSSRLRVQGRAAVIQAWIAAYRGDVPGIIRYARRALECLPECDATWRSLAYDNLGNAYSFVGEADSAYQAREKGLEVSRATGNIYMILFLSLKLVVTLREQGRLQQVLDICQQQKLEITNEYGLSQTAMVGWLYTLWREVLKEAASTKPKLDQSGLIEPLSEREIEVLQLLAKGTNNQAIATRLVLSPHTVKTHACNIYSKLAVNNRTQAVERARTLGILHAIKINEYLKSYELHMVLRPNWAAFAAQFFYSR